MRTPSSHATARRELTGLLLHSRGALRGLTADLATQVPLTLISGTHTSPPAAPLRRAATRWHARLVAESPGARHITVDTGGHFIPRYQPDRVIAAVTDLLDRIARPDGRPSQYEPQHIT
jgi:pimeloyl-ACP methyl ester carboxylesterase